METFLKIIILIIIFIIFYIINLYINTQENFQTYSYGPFNYTTTGTDPLTFYKYPVYRNPYMYPYKYFSSYPYPHMTYNQINV
jgi:hypothetical protein